MSNGTLRKYVNDPQFWTAFIEEIDETVASLHRRLEQAAEPTDIYRVQGEISALKRMKLMRDKYNG